MTESPCYNIFSIFDVQLKHVHCVTEHEQCGNQDNHEVTDIRNSLTDQSDVERCLFKQFQPIQHFEPSQHDCKGSDEPLIKEDRIGNSSETDSDDPG